MAMTIQAADAILKEDYLPPVREQLNSATYLLTKLKRNTDDFVGREAYVPVHKGRNVGVGAKKEMANLPTAGNQQFDKALWKVKYLYGTFKLSGPVIKATKNNTGAFVRALQTEMEGLMRDVKVDQNRQFWHNGTGVLTACGASGPSNDVTVSSTRFLEPGMEIDISTMADGTAIALGRTVSSITSSTVFVVSGAPVTVTTAEAVYRAGTRVLATWGETAEMWGLEALIAAANPGGGLTTYPGEISKSSNTWWRSNVLDNGGTARPTTTDLMQQAFDKSDIEGAAVPGLIVTNHALKRRYAALLVSDKRYPAGGEITLDGGYKALEFNGVALVADKDAGLTNTPAVLNRMYFLDMSTFTYHVLQDWDWMDQDGAVLARVSGVDAYEGTLYAYVQLSCDRPNANTVLTDLSES